MLAGQPPRGKIIVFGIAFWYPLAGVTFQFLHYLIGLRRLGYDVSYVEDCPRMVYDPCLNDFSADASGNIRSIAPILESHGWAGRWAFRDVAGKLHGMEEAQLGQLYRNADACLNVTGSQEMRDEHLAIRRRIYVETDPVVSQILADAGDAKTVAQLSAHDTVFTYGENIGQADCLLPTGGFQWLPTRQPVVMDLWGEEVGRGQLAVGGSGSVLPTANCQPPTTYTTIGTWKNKGKDIVYRGEPYYWSKDREFMKFLELPSRSSAAFELATGVDEQTGRMLREHGWRLADALEVSRSLDDYRGYIQQSRGEFTVAKDQNIRLKSGWFSDRSCCYLAAGRPVITQETGFSKFLPTGEGLFGFETMEEILAAVEKIEQDYAKACRAAREIAAEYFKAERVLRQLLERAEL